MNTKNAKDKGVPKLPACGIIIGSHHHGPAFRTAEHQHPYHSLLYIVAGEGKCIIAEKAYKLLANTAIMLKKGQRHQLADNPGRAMVVFVVYFSDYVAGSGKGVFYPLLESGRTVVIPGPRAQQIRKYLRQMLHEQDNKPEEYQTAIQLCLCAIILEIYRENLKKDKLVSGTTGTSIERVEKVLEYITEKHYEPHSLSAAAKMAHLSQRQFANLCRKITQKSFIEYLNTTRLKKAKELLTKTDMPVSAVAFETGFEEMSTFYRAFRKYYKRPPLSLRAKS